MIGKRGGGNLESFFQRRRVALANRLQNRAEIRRHRDQEEHHARDDVTHSRFEYIIFGAVHRQSIRGGRLTVLILIFNKLLSTIIVGYNNWWVICASRTAKYV